jgi:hypothetical protein
MVNYAKKEQYNKKQLTLRVHKHKQLLAKLEKVQSKLEEFAITKWWHIDNPF